LAKEEATKQSAKRREVDEGNRGDLDEIATLGCASLAMTADAAIRHCEGMPMYRYDRSNLNPAG
jgi:hypothetical protein